MVRNDLVICRVTVLTVNECVLRSSRYPRIALTGVVTRACIGLRLDDVLTGQRPDSSNEKDTIK